MNILHWNWNTQDFSISYSLFISLFLQWKALYLNIIVISLSNCIHIILFKFLHLKHNQFLYRLVTFGKLCNRFRISVFIYKKIKNNDRTYLLELLWELTVLKYVKHLEQCLVFKKHNFTITCMAYFPSLCI